MEGMKAYLAPDVLLRLLINRRDRVAAEKMLVMANEKKCELVTSLFALFEAVASVEEYDEFDAKMLMRILRDVTIETKFEEELRPMYKSFNDERKMRLRSIATDMEGGR